MQTTAMHNYYTINLYTLFYSRLGNVYPKIGERLLFGIIPNNSLSPTQHVF